MALIGFPEAEPFANAAGTPFIPFCEQEYPIGSIAGIVEELSRRQARDAAEYIHLAMA